MFGFELDRKVNIWTLILLSTLLWSWVRQPINLVLGTIKDRERRLEAVEMLAGVTNAARLFTLEEASSENIRQHVSILASISNLVVAVHDLNEKVNSIP